MVYDVVLLETKLERQPRSQFRRPEMYAKKSKLFPKGDREPVNA